MSAKEMRYELARAATIAEFKTLPPEKRHRVIHDRLDAGDTEYLNVIDSVPGLVSPEEGRRSDALRMKAIDPESLGELTNLQGPLTYDGRHQAYANTSSTDLARRLNASSSPPRRPLSRWLHRARREPGDIQPICLRIEKREPVHRQHSICKRFSLADRI